MQITYQKTRENEDDITVWWTLTDDTQTSYEWHGDIPKGVAVQIYLESQMSNYLQLIRRREYPDMTPNTEDIDQWIINNPEAVKVPWTNKHPVEVNLFDRNKITTEAKNLLRDAKDIEDIKNYLKLIHGV